MPDDDRRARIDVVKGEFVRRGTCKGCGKPVTREKTFSGSTFAGCQRQADEWTKTPLRHKKCEAR